MKVVLDTNVWLSALFWEGEADNIIEEAEKNKFKIIITREILLEIVKVIESEAKFQKFIKDRKQSIEKLTRTILHIADIIETSSKINLIKKHIQDNIVLEAAFDGKANYIVSYDRHILDLVEFKNIRILSPTDFIKMRKQIT